MDRKLSAMTRLFAFTDEVAEQVRTVPEVEERIQIRNELMRDRFERDLLVAGWHRLTKGDVFTPLQGRRSLVVGSVLWSRDDLDILASLAAAPLREDTDVYIFILDDVQSEDDLSRFMPGVPLPTKTPVAAKYKGSELQRFADGTAVTALLDI
jgi:hypothetical protein